MYFLIIGREKKKRETNNNLQTVAVVNISLVDCNSITKLPACTVI